MASLISSGDKESFQNSYLDFFDTFKEAIVIHKTPKKVFSNTANPSVYGYGENSNKSNLTLVPVSGIYSGIVTYADEQKHNILGDINETLEEGEIIIDIKKDARDFMKSGITPLVEINGSRFIPVSSERMRNFLDSEFYSFKLKHTN